MNVLGRPGRVSEPVQVQRRIRRRIAGDGVAADVIADLNIHIASGSATAVSTQQISQRQGRSAPAARQSKTKEQP
jgi:hypothetical protein